MCDLKLRVTVLVVTLQLADTLQVIRSDVGRARASYDGSTIRLIRKMECGVKHDRLKGGA